MNFLTSSTSITDVLNYCTHSPYHDVLGLDTERTYPSFAAALGALQDAAAAIGRAVDFGGAERLPAYVYALRAAVEAHGPLTVRYALEPDSGDVVPALAAEPEIPTLLSGLIEVVCTEYGIDRARDLLARVLWDLAGDTPDAVEWVLYGADGEALGLYADYRRAVLALHSVACHWQRPVEGRLGEIYVQTPRERFYVRRVGR